jgi:hypothetical protein
MSKKPYKSTTQMDEELADLTDRILSDQSAEDIAMDEELHSLQGTVSLLNLIAKKPSSDVSMQRIEKQLINEWYKNRDRSEKKSAWQKFLARSRPWQSSPQQQWTFAFAVIALFLIVILIFPLNQLIPPNIQATAGNANQSQLALFIMATILVVGLLWFSRNKS